LLAIGSFVLWSASVALWIRSYLVSDSIAFSTPARWSIVTTCTGGLLVLNQPFATPAGWSWMGADWGTGDPGGLPTIGHRKWSCLGIQYRVFFSSNSRNGWLCHLRIWILCLLTAIPTLICCIQILLRRRTMEGRCAVCGYDLRASKD